MTPPLLLPVFDGRIKKKIAVTLKTKIKPHSSITVRLPLGFPPYEDVLPSFPFQTHFCLLHFSFILSRLISFTLLPSMLNLLVDSKNGKLVSSYAWLFKKLNRAQIIKSKNQPLSSLIPNLKENLVKHVTVKKLEKTILRLFLKTHLYPDECI